MYYITVTKPERPSSEGVTVMKAVVIVIRELKQTTTTTASHQTNGEK